MPSIRDDLRDRRQSSSVTDPGRRRFLGYASSGAAAWALSGYAIAARATPDTAFAGAMAQGRPSTTAQGAAVLRAAHQLFDMPTVFADPLALKIIGARAEALLSTHPRRARTLRAFVALRSRYAEDQLAQFVENGVREYVILGAGLDTFAYRNAHAGLRVFEVDHPATQVWKKQRLARAGIAVPDMSPFAPCDFEVQSLADALLAAGFNNAAPAFFSMLGVAIYLTKPALTATLSYVASLPKGSGIVFSYSIPSDRLTAAQQARRVESEKRASAIGEPWISYFDPDELAAHLADLGFGSVRDLGPEEANDRYFSGRADGLRVAGTSRLMCAHS